MGCLGCLEVKSRFRTYASKDNFEVSEHAIIRYFERVLDYDLDDIKNKILITEIIQLSKILDGNGGCPNDGFKAVMKEFTVVTEKGNK